MVNGYTSPRRLNPPRPARSLTASSGGHRVSAWNCFSRSPVSGMCVGLPELRHACRSSGRALVFGLPLTLVVFAVFAHLVSGLPWLEAFLLGAVLSPQTRSLPPRSSAARRSLSGCATCSTPSP